MAGFGDITGMLRKVQEMQSNMKEIQEKLKDQVVEAGAGGGMVKAKMNGKFELLELKIDSEVVDVNDLEMLEDLIKAAVNSAVAATEEKNQEQMKDKMSDVMGGLNIPGLDKLGPLLGLK